MVIEKGGPWGAPAPGVTAPIMDTTVDLAAAAHRAWQEGRVLEAAVGPGAPDVLSQLGVEPGRPADERYRYPFDLGLVTGDDGVERPFVAHAVARRPGWSGRFAVAMNVGWWGDWYLGPRAHPNDGLLDITVGHMPFRQRPAARRRVRTGSHLPHPLLKTVRRAGWEQVFERPTPLLVDGQQVALTRRIEVRAVPDALAVIV